jgi:hypothetical protein
MQDKWHVVWDIEANNLLNSDTIDYTTVPYKLKPSFKLHCIVVDVLKADGTTWLVAFHDGPKYVFDGQAILEVIDGVDYALPAGYEPMEYIHRPLSSFPSFVAALPEGSTIVGHNIINYDLLATKLYYGIPFEIERDMGMDCPLGDDTWNGKPVVFDDTLVRAKTLNPDRFGGNSLDALSQKGGVQKLAFRKHLSKDERFTHFAADMLYYNIFDCKSNRSVATMLDIEAHEWNWGKKWNRAIKLEKAVLDLITRQEHRGFKFDNALAGSNIAELDALMEERRAKVEPILPAKPATKKAMDDSTPPKLQFKKNGDPSANIIKFAEKMGAELIDGNFVWEGKQYKLPMEQLPLVTSLAASISDTTHIKDWLVGLGWVPMEYKEKDLTVNTKKEKLSPEKLQKAIERYTEQTLSTNFMYDRVEHIMQNKSTLPTRQKLKPPQAGRFLEMEIGKRLQRGAGLKVLTNPSFTVGMEKEICPNLESLAKSDKRLEHITDIVEYLTYRHRRNSILGGGVAWDEDEEPEKGYVSAVRDDGRIPTPADTCGAATSRMKHRLVANIPRVTSLYGPKMRGLFGVDDDCYQLGYDFDSLEAREEAHFCWDFEAGSVKEYCTSLLMEKPLDVHSMMAKKISTIIGRDFDRAPAKSVKYGATYGAQAAKVAKTIGSDLATGQIVFDAFWEAASPLKGLKVFLQKEWAEFNKRKIVGIDGRLVPTRSAHAILNSKFQSSGVICAKRAMVLHDRKLKKAGLLVDFFEDTLDNKQWAQQLIAMHDEAQMEVSKKSVEFKMFETKEDAQLFKDEQANAGKIWSDIKKSSKGGVYVAYCLAGHLASEAVAEVGIDFNMNIMLTAGYQIGRNWAECH